MKVRAIKDICQLSDTDYFQVVSEGLEKISANAESFLKNANSLNDTGCEGISPLVLCGIAEEEAGKFLLLVDSVRCPKRHKRFAKHLQGFNEHIAKGIYVECYQMRPATFGEFSKYVNFCRVEYFLDGPEGG